MCRFMRSSTTLKELCIFDIVLLRMKRHSVKLLNNKPFLRLFALFLFLTFMSVYLRWIDPNKVSVASAVHYVVHDIIIPLAGQKIIEKALKHLK